VPRISKRLIDALVPAARDVWLWDDSLLGFGLRLTPGGARTFVIQYRTPAGKTRRLAIGRHGRVTPEQARKIAAAKIASVAAGADPSAERRAAREVRETPATVGTLASAWLVHQRARLAKGKLRARTLAEYERQIETSILPRLGRAPLGDLKASDAQRLHDEHADHPVLANRVLDLFSAVWRWGESSGFVSGANPCRSVERNTERRRDRHLRHDELAALGAALRNLVAARAISPHVAALVRLIALTGCRPGEIKSMQWNDADLGRHVLHLRGAKTGDRDVWLSEPALAVLRDLPRKRGEPFVFPSRLDPQRHVGEFRKPWAKTLEAAGIEHVEPYVLRHTFASESEAVGHSPYLTSELLGHAMRQRDMTRGYVHHVPDDVRRASERVAGRIASALDGTAPGNLVSILEAARG